MLDVLVAETILVDSLAELTGRVDEQYLALTGRRFVPIEHKDAGGDAGAIEEVRREPDGGLEEVLPEEPLADLAFGGLAEEHAVRHHHAKAATGVEHGDHVLDERQVALGLRRGNVPDAVELM